MIIRETELPGVLVLEPERRADERGFFARTFCVDELGAQGIEASVVQSNISFSPRRGTLRGMHLQRPPHGETKVIRCTRGALFDVLVDLRPESPTFRRWTALELSADNRLAFYAPVGVAHGCLTLTDDVEVLYLMGSRYVPSAATGYRYDDPAFGIVWPFPPSVIAPSDLAFPAFGS